LSAYDSLSKRVMANQHEVSRTGKVKLPARRHQAHGMLDRQLEAAGSGGDGMTLRYGLSVQAG